MTLALAILKEQEYSEVLDGMKNLLKECYPISDEEAKMVLTKGIETSEALLVDYVPYINSIVETISGIRSTLDKHMNQAQQQEGLDSKMINEAAVWHAFECMRQCYKSMANDFV
ncbi:hypothetical protein [Paenibacillus cremeus]|uniref:Uncharacterized protein n=1 Tax=Paenibacillus cremeus TaxID=2163881 RepID=A0A559K7L4_9BACL|nr:hypothetical protein [Paenibacillus cremeus]TVY08125.1 hypothetical protein FPZ49_20465 [Paenibacillus cremeus]